MKNAIKNRIFSTLWLIFPTKLQEVIDFVERQANFQQIKKAIESSPTLSAWEEQNNPSQRRYYTVEGNTAVMRLHGTIVRYANLFTEWCGGVSLEMFMKDFEALNARKDIEKIIIDIDSPGGEANGISDAAKRIREASKNKEIVAYASGMACSAAYWLGAATREFYVSDSAIIGSIGTVIEFTDDTKKKAMEGLEDVSVVSDQSPGKRIDLRTEEGKKEIKETMLNPMAQVFIEAVASYRSTTADRVISDYGHGGVLIGEGAVKVGMVDGITTLNQILGENMTEEEKQKYRQEVLQAENERMKAIEAICDDSGLIAEAKANQNWTDKDVAYEMVKRGISTIDQKKAERQRDKDIVSADKELLTMRSNPEQTQESLLAVARTRVTGE